MANWTARNALAVFQPIVDGVSADRGRYFSDRGRNAQDDRCGARSAGRCTTHNCRRFRQANRTAFDAVTVLGHNHCFEHLSCQVASRAPRTIKAEILWKSRILQGFTAWTTNPFPAGPLLAAAIPTAAENFSSSICDNTNTH